MIICFYIAFHQVKYCYKRYMFLHFLFMSQLFIVFLLLKIIYVYTFLYIKLNKNFILYFSEVFFISQNCLIYHINTKQKNDSCKENFAFHIYYIGSYGSFITNMYIQVTKHFRFHDALFFTEETLCFTTSQAKHDRIKSIAR